MPAPYKMSVEEALKQMLEAPTESPFDRPIIHNPDLTHSTMRTSIFNDDKGSPTLLPTIFNGKEHAPKIAAARAFENNQHFGKYKTIEAANLVDQMMHKYADARHRVNKLGSMQPETLTEVIAYLRGFE